MQLDTNNHSVFMLHYHLIMCIKYRNKVIDDIISNRLKEIFEKIAPAYNITLEEWNHDTDHVHILFKGQPNTEISRFRAKVKCIFQTICLINNFMSIHTKQLVL